MGTHPIFESDFDCLTDRTKMSKLNWRNWLPKLKRDVKDRKRLFLIKLSEKKFQLQSCMKMMRHWLSEISTLKHQLTFLSFQKQEFQCLKKLLMKTLNF